jgi:hypothetical protein
MSLSALANYTFDPDQIIPFNTVVPDPSYVLGGPITIEDPGFPASEADQGQPDLFQIVGLDLSTANSYRLGTAMIQDFVIEPNGTIGDVGGPFTADIIGVNENQVIFGINLNGQPPNPNPPAGLSYYDEYGIVSLTSVDGSGSPTYPINFVFDANTYQAAPCFGRGTLIATRKGDVAVESIAIGDEVRTLSGAFRKVVWAGHRSVDLTRHNNPELARPVRIAAGALEDNVPSRDLVVSPDHNLFLEGVLIPAKCLVNGSTIDILDVAGVTYHHIELETHDIVLAEGAAAETYLDTGNRTAFAGQGVTDVHPDFSTAPDVNFFSWDAKGAAKLVVAGAELERARAVIARRAAETDGRVAFADVA